MYQPDPLNWIAGDDSSRRTGPPQLGQVVTGGSENFWMTSNRLRSASHWYLVQRHGSVAVLLLCIVGGQGTSVERRPRPVANQRRPLQMDRQHSRPQHIVMERLQVEAGTLSFASIISELDEHEFTKGI